MIGALDSFGDAARRREKMAVKGLLNREEKRKRECGRCHKKGTKYCSKANLCVCRGEFEGSWCHHCKNKTNYVDKKGMCAPCPCLLNRSDGTCHYQREENKVECNNCKEAFAGYNCNACAATFHWEKTNSTCVRGPQPSSSLPYVSNSPEEIIAIFSVSLLGLLVFVAIVGVVVFRRHKRVNRVRKRLVAEDKHLLTNNSGDDVFSESNGTPGQILFSYNDDSDDSDEYGYDEEVLTGNNSATAVIRMDKLRQNDGGNGTTKRFCLNDDGDTPEQARAKNDDKSLKKDSSSFYILTMSDPQDLGDPV